MGKTATTLSVGTELAALGRRVLLVDLDPQSNLTMAVGLDPLTISRSVYDLLLDPNQDIASIIRTTTYGPDVLPANQALANAELMLSTRLGREQIVRKLLARVRDNYH